MANFKLCFLDEKSEDEIQVFCNTENKIFLSINDDELGSPYVNSAFITLDIDTAIKFSKELRRHIAIAKSNVEFEKEQANGYGITIF